MSKFVVNKEECRKPKKKKRNVDHPICNIETEVIVYLPISSPNPIQAPQDHLTLQNDLNTLSEWSVKWQMYFNVSKCYCLTITAKHKNSHFQYTMNGSPLIRVSSSKYLGVTVDGKLSWAHMWLKSLQRPPKP